MPIETVHGAAESGQLGLEPSIYNQPEISAGFVEKLLKLERLVAERFYAPYREQFNPDFTVPDSVVEEWISVERLGKEKITASRNRSSIGRLPKEPPLIVEVET